MYFESAVYNVSESNGLALISLIADGISQFPYFVFLEVDSKTASKYDVCPCTCGCIHMFVSVYKHICKIYAHNIMCMYT